MNKEKEEEEEGEEEEIPQGLLNMELHFLPKPDDAVRTDVDAYSGLLVIETVANLRV